MTIDKQPQRSDQANGYALDGTGKPTPTKPKFENFPAELKSLANWVNWRYLPPKSQGGKWRKVPFQPNGKPADTTDRSTWNPFDDCCAAYARGGFDGVGFVFDGEIGEDGLCYCGVDFDACIENGKDLQSLAKTRIKRLNTYTERSVSDTGIHCIARAEPLDRIVKFDGVEIYTKARYFTFTGVAVGQIKAAPNEIRALVNEVRAKEAAVKQQQSGPFGSKPASSTELPDPFHDTKPAQLLADLEPVDLAEGISTTRWFEILSPELKNEVVDYALGVIAKNTRLLELEANGGNNAEYYKLTMSVARSGAPSAEDIFVKHASGAKNADSEEGLRQHFSRCRASKPSGDREITVGTLLLLAQQSGADFDQWKYPAPPVGASPPVIWFPDRLKVSFSNIPHRQWLYGLDLVRGEITVLGSPGGIGKSSLAIGMAVSIATGSELLGEKVRGGNDLKVMIINGEDDGTEIKRRIWAFCLAHNVAEQTLGRLYVAGKDDGPVQRLSFLRTTDKNVSQLDESGFKVLEAALEALSPDLIILDPLVAFCGSGNMNDNTVMSQLMRELKRLATKFNCAMLIVHHTRKGGDVGNAESISGAASIVNLARRAIMPVPMTDKEAPQLGILPSERFGYFKLIDAKSNLAPRSADSPWYHLHSIGLPNPEPPIYPYGDSVQALVRTNLSTVHAAPVTTDDQKIRNAILDLVECGKFIDGQSYPFSPSPGGANNERALLNEAMAAVSNATASLQWRQEDLKSVTLNTIKKLMSEGCLVVKDMKELMSEPGRFRKGRGLKVARIPQVASTNDTRSEATMLEPTSQC